MIDTGMFSYPEPDEKLKRGSFTDMLSFLGPGMILASASIGSGELFFSSRGGAIFKYTLLWAFLLGVIMKGLTIYTGTRYMTITGEHPLTRWGEIFPGPKAWFPTIMGFFAIISFPSWAAGFAVFLGQWSVWVFGFGNQQVWATFWILVVTILVFLAAYSFVEQLQTWVVAILLLMVVVSVFVSHPDWLEVLAGLIPHIPEGFEPWIADKYPDIASRSIPLEIITYIGALGGGTYDYFGYLGLYREKKWGMLGNPDLSKIEEQLLALKTDERIPLPEKESETKKAKAWMKAAATDGFSSFLSVFIFSAAFMILGNVILKPQQVIPDDYQIMQLQAQYLTNIHPILLYLYEIGVFCAFFGTMQACASQLYAYTLYESIGPLLRHLGVKNWNINLARIIEVALYSGGGVILIWTGISFTSLVSFGSLIGGMFGVGLWALAMLYTDKKFLPKSYQMSTLLSTCVALSGIAMTIMGVIGILQFFHIM